MGIFGAITNAAKSVVTTWTNAIKNPVSTLRDIVVTTSAVTANPVTAITKGRDAAITQAYNSTPTANITKSVLNVGTVAAAVVGAGGAVTAARSGTLAKTASKLALTLTPKSVAGKVAGAVAVPIVAGAVVANPTKAATTVASAPSEVGQFVADLGNLGANPSIASAKEVVSNSPLLSTGAALLVAAPVVSSTLPVIGNIIGREIQTADIKNSINDAVPITVVDKSALLPVSTNTGVMNPQTPQTQTVSSLTPTKRKKTLKKAVMHNISQKVNVLVNTGTTKNYINKRVSRRVWA